MIHVTSSGFSGRCHKFTSLPSVFQAHGTLRSVFLQSGAWLCSQFWLIMYDRNVMCHSGQSTWEQSLSLDSDVNPIRWGSFYQSGPWVTWWSWVLFFFTFWYQPVLGQGLKKWFVPPISWDLSDWGYLCISGLSHWNKYFFKWVASYLCITLNLYFIWQVSKSFKPTF
jgi:hypothetical protein